MYGGALLLIVIGLSGSLAAIPVFIAKITEKSSHRKVNKKYFQQQKSLE